MNQVNPADEVIIEEKGRIGLITLNRPKALNALSLNMIELISQALSDWEGGSQIERVIFTGAGEKAFCAGGDIKAFYRSAKAHLAREEDGFNPALYFGAEYLLNKQIFHYSKPTIALMNGITMGGGYGIAGHCKQRVACEHTVFAMPEVNIGFFPDVGAVYHLLKAPQGFGHYLALSGDSIGAGDMIAAELADVFIPRADFEAIINDDNIENYEAEPPPAEMFGSQPVPHNDYASPLSVAVTVEHLKRMQGQDFDTVIAADFALLQHFVDGGEFLEGVRAMLIDKDRKPCWSEVTDDIAGRYLKPAQYDLNTFQNLNF